MTVTAPPLHNPATNTAPPAAWGDAINDDLTSIDSRLTAVEAEDHPLIIARHSTGLDIVNTTVETALASMTVPGGIMGTGKFVKLEIVGDQLNNSGAGAAYTVKVTFGGTVIYQDLSPSWTTSASRRALYIQVLIGNQNSASVQKGGLMLMASSPTAPTVGAGDLSAANSVSSGALLTGSKDTSQAQVLAVTITHGSAAATLSVQRFWAVATLL